MMNDAETFLDGLPFVRQLGPEQRQLLRSALTAKEYGFGQRIITEGSDVDGLYVLYEGKARIVKQAENGDELPLNMLAPGSYFGEMSLLNHSKASATVRASGKVKVFYLHRDSFELLLGQAPEWYEFFVLKARERSLANFFTEFSAFKNLSACEFQTLLNGLEELRAAPGETIVRQGDPPGAMFFLKDGRARVLGESPEGQRQLAFLRRGDYFGELSLIKGVARAATVVAETALELLKLDPEVFRALADSNEEFKKRVEERVAQYDYQLEARVPLDFEQENLPAAAACQTVRKASEEPLVLGPAEEDQPEAPAENAPQARKKRIRRFPVVYQIDEADCGPACLAMICRYYGKDISLARIRELSFATTDGTSLDALCNAADALGLAARAVKVSKRNLSQIPLPAIVHWQGNHWIVLFDVDAGGVRVSDPAMGIRRLPLQEFEDNWSGYSALFDYTTRFEAASESRATFRWLFPFFKPHLGIFGQCLALSLVTSALQMVLPVITQLIIDKVLVEGDMGLLNILMITMFASVALMTAAGVVERYLMSFAATRIDAATLDYLTRTLLALPMSYFRNRRTGDIQRRLEGVREVREFISQNGVTGLSAGVQLAVSLLLMLLYSPLLTGVFLLMTPAYLALMRFSARWLKPLFDSVEEGLGKYHSRQIDAIRGIETVKALAGERYFREGLLREFHRISHKLRRSNFTSLSYEAATQVVSFISLTLFLWIGAYQVMTGSMSLGALMAFNALVALANGPILTLLNLWDNCQFSTVLLNRLNDVFESEPEQGRDHSQLLPVRTLAGDVRLDRLGLSFGPEGESKILEDISFEAPAGRTVAIVGRSGSGKTSLLRCLSGLTEPTSGTIFFDNVDFRTLRHRDLRRQIGMVLQDNYLFDDTIAHNIACSGEDLDMERVAWASHVACIDEFVERLPLGYDTRVGESGIALSGGQRQRLAIARAIYHEPAVLLLDEATSALDTESERAIQTNLRDFLRGRTFFVVAHRLSTIRDADQIIVLEKGRIAEHGNHDELMDRRGLYFYLCSQQIGGG